MGKSRSPVGIYGKDFYAKEGIPEFPVDDVSFYFHMDMNSMELQMLWA